jgi:bifunctional pyridoxal-dependent enzyme with beta-cystathionase and maltose regulon repressor activities
MERRHGWGGSGLIASVSPSIGTSIGVLIGLLTEENDGVILQPPVFTDFKPLIKRAGREPIRNSLRLDNGCYTMDLEDLAARASKPENKVLILCNPHNPVGRVWTVEELKAVAEICSAGGVTVISDEIHADLALSPNHFVPFATAAEGSGVRWAATHGPVKTFGVAGVADTLLITDDEELSTGFRAMAERLHVTRNNVFALAATKAGYLAGDEWVDGLLALVADNVETLEQSLPGGVDLIYPEGTYLAWLDFGQLEMDVPELAKWLVGEARLALSPGHWFGREGAGFARMTIAVAPVIIDEAVGRLRTAVAKR